MADRSLTELCTICHINVPKYTCPRCASRSCSLACSKRHKVWSQCSGVRDPAAYVKRKELATPTAFDKDFNFISGIERFIERADRDVENRGIAVDDAEQSRKKRRTGEVSFWKKIEDSGVDVIRAPIGMTRNLQNLSQWHKKHKCINWTVEWVFPSGQKVVTKCLATTTIGTAFSRTGYAKEHSLFQKKRDVQRAPEIKTEPDEAESTFIKKEEEEPADYPESAPLFNIEEVDRKYTRGRSHTLSLDPPAEEPVSEQQPIKSENDENCSANTAATFNIDPSVLIYLHRPKSCAKVPVLIPLSHSMTLSEALQGRKVLEFPTLYVLLHSTDKPADDKHMLEEDYLREYGAEETVAESQDGQEGQEIGNDVAEIAQKFTSVDESKVLEVLQKDLGVE